MEISRLGIEKRLRRSDKGLRIVRFVYLFSNCKINKSMVDHKSPERDSAEPLQGFVRKGRIHNSRIFSYGSYRS